MKPDCLPQSLGGKSVPPDTIVYQSEKALCSWERVVLVKVHWEEALKWDIWYGQILIGQEYKAKKKTNWGQFLNIKLLDLQLIFLLGHLI